MKRIATALLAAALTLALALGVCGCDKDTAASSQAASSKPAAKPSSQPVSSAEPVPTDEELFVGKWTTTLDLSQAVNASIGESDKLLAENVVIRGYTLTFYYEYNADGTYHVTIDERSYDKASAQMLKSLKEGMPGYLLATLREAGYDMTLEEYYRQSGMTADDLAKLIEEEFKADAMFDELLVEGKWQIKNGRLFTSRAVDEDIDSTRYEVYRISADELEFRKAVLSSNATRLRGIEQRIVDLYPITFTRVK